MKKLIYICLLTLLLFGCKRNEDTELVTPSPSPATNHLHKFWYYAGGMYEIGSGNYSLIFHSGRFLNLTQNEIAVVALDNVVGNVTTGCEMFQTTYRETNQRIYLRYHPCTEFSDSLFYVKHLSADSLTLRTRGYRNPNPNSTDSVYCELYFRKNP